MNNIYLFSSERLGFRNWADKDLEPMSKINADQEVMEYFPRTQTKEETKGFIKRMQDQYETKGFCYFAVDQLDNNQLIGFIGLSEQRYEASFTPCVDIGWRLGKQHWGQGLATEGARRCLTFASRDLNLKKVYSIASVINTKSISVMKKIEMKYVETFDHILLHDFEKIKSCVLYEYDMDTEGINNANAKGASRLLGNKGCRFRILSATSRGQLKDALRVELKFMA
jgi:RimJ/RimL family protein N-acetyltransferase